MTRRDSAKGLSGPLVLEAGSLEDQIKKRVSKSAKTAIFTFQFCACCLERRGLLEPHWALNADSAQLQNPNSNHDSNARLANRG